MFAENQNIKKQNGKQKDGHEPAGEIVSVFFIKFVREFKKSLFLLQFFLSKTSKKPPPH
jgi:hypothetical protein